MSTTTTDTSTTEASVMTILSGYWPAKVLSTAVELGVFDALADAERTAAELAERLDLHQPGLVDFLLALEAIGMVDSDGGRYRNSAEVRRHLVAGAPEYIGGYVTFCDREMKPAWDGLATALRTGRPQNPAAVDANPYDTMYQDDEVTRAFLDSMDMFCSPAAELFAMFDWAAYRTLVDVGGARGSFARRIVAEHPHLTATVFDLPPLRAEFDELTAATDTELPVTFHGGDFLQDPLPAADVVVFGHVLLNWDVETRIALLRKAYDAVPSGGAVYVYDPMTTAGERPPLNSVLTSLDMLVWSRGGGDYSVADCHRWLTGAGFEPSTVETPGAAEDVVVKGIKRKRRAAGPGG